ncbi:prepilin-type N-terminal cleavage/methylation domain-containing protein [Vibrio sp. DW001]|uniref:prepilin-type N-terminal cleavage/methylation domain-containing protein n=1 Tax=Vibrio sp. DW001 TaxID=2912315 RepID=UPI0023B14410|nr:prepilin-type N-terminal cleavage/methylation domain-containing protein [Vibrio sp. DW001]WED27311.1 prepilin-type N-terminal cleavage/methylation domain-containing protein [Vibrio sp. DW001]
MNRGFTLVELLVVLSVSSVLLSVALPNVQLFYQNYQLRQRAVELKSFFSQARVEALTRRQDLWVRYSEGEGGSVNGWRLSLVQHNRVTGDDNEIASTQGEGTPLSPSWTSIKLDGRTGRVLENGYLLIGDKAANRTSLKLITHHITGRVRICAIGEQFYGYSKC